MFSVPCHQAVLVWPRCPRGKCYIPSSIPSSIPGSIPGSIPSTGCSRGGETAGGEAEPSPAASLSGSGADLMPGAVCSHELGFIPQLFPWKSVRLLMVNRPRPWYPTVGTTARRLARCSGAPGASSLSFRDLEQGDAAMPLITSVSFPSSLELERAGSSSGTRRCSQAPQTGSIRAPGKDGSGAERSVLLRAASDRKGKYDKSLRIRGLADIKIKP